MEPIDRATAKQLFEHYRKDRSGIRKREEMATICLICGSVHIIPKEGDPHTLVCRDCGFSFERYQCPVCDETIDGRDPQNPMCRSCEERICTCGACDCSPD